MGNQHWLKEELYFFFGFSGFDFQLAIFNWLEAESLSRTSGSCFSPRNGSKERKRGHYLDIGGFFIILSKAPPSLSLNSKDLSNCLAQGAAQHQPLTRADAAGERNLVCLNGSWLGSELYASSIFSSAPKRRYVPVSYSQHSLWWELSFCLSAVCQAINISPTWKPWVVSYQVLLLGDGSFSAGCGIYKPVQRGICATKNFTSLCRLLSKSLQIITVRAPLKSET